MTAPAGAPAASTATEKGVLTCVFAVCEAAQLAELGPCTGYDGGSAPYRLALAGGPDGRVLHALAQDVPASAFCEQALRDRLADPADLAAVARTHHAMVTAAAAAGPAVPLPLGTLFTDRTRATQQLSAQAAQFRSVLDRLRDRTEWAVKVYVNRTAHGPAGELTVPSAPPRKSTIPPPGAGRAYLDRIRARRQDQESRQEAALAETTRVDEAIKSLADGAVRRRPHAARADGRVQVLNGAYLVDTRRTGAFHELVAALQASADAVEIEVSGPWVPYSFAAVDAG